ncbi:ubiquitin-conjugating enzyme E2 [Anopheles sinensis]|uniref:Ubiquitin-conjugating enzyme E2 n=1 Tax=Anopheles sinensis TaxID=74873 RepID=A0A084VBF1_ANOSI|nr:ubiquitin-conjugating enzyme E2 [Anopheles sinensis]
MWFPLHTLKVSVIERRSEPQDRTTSTPVTIVGGWKVCKGRKGERKKIDRCSRY